MYTLNKDAQAQCKTDLNALEEVKARHVDLNFYYDCLTMYSGLLTILARLGGVAFKDDLFKALSLKDETRICMTTFNKYLKVLQQKGLISNQMSKKRDMSSTILMKELGYNYLNEDKHHIQENASKNNNQNKNFAKLEVEGARYYFATINGSNWHNFKQFKRHFLYVRYKSGVYDLMYLYQGQEMRKVEKDFQEIRETLKLKNDANLKNLKGVIFVVGCSENVSFEKKKESLEKNCLKGLAFFGKQDLKMMNFIEVELKC